MQSAAPRANGMVRILAGVAAGVVVLVDNFWAAGEVSPIVIVTLLLVAIFLAGAVWGPRGWPAAAATWARIPLAHLVNHLPRHARYLASEHYLSMLYLAAFCLVVSAIRFGVFPRPVAMSDRLVPHAAT